MSGREVVHFDRVSKHFFKTTITYIINHIVQSNPRESTDGGFPLVQILNLKPSIRNKHSNYHLRILVINPHPNNLLGGYQRFNLCAHVRDTRHIAKRLFTLYQD